MPYTPAFARKPLPPEPAPAPAAPAPARAPAVEQAPRYREAADEARRLEQELASWQREQVVREQCRQQLENRLELLAHYAKLKVLPPAIKTDTGPRLPGPHPIEAASNR